MPKQTCYYAHSKLDYGTKREAEEIAYLSKYYNVLDPNSFIGERGAMFPYLAAVAMCNTVVVSPHDGYYVGKGCFHEVCAALALSIQCRLMDGIPCDVSDMKLVTGIQIYDNNDWKKRYALLLL